jgi:hypothetical protein
MNGKLKLGFATAICCAGFSAVAQGVIHFPFLSDNFADRGIISETDITVFSSLSNATSEADEPFIDGVSSGQTVWGTWTAPSNGIVTLSANAETFSPLLTIYQGNELAELSLIASNNYLIRYESTNCGYHWRERNQITFHVASGQAYQICVDSAIITDATWELQTIPAGNPTPTGAIPAYANAGIGQGIISWTFYVPILITNMVPGGNMELGLQLTPAPQNDDFVNRIKFSGSRINFAISNAGATKESGEPDHSGNPGGSSVWYSWTAPAAGRVTLSINEVPVFSPPSSSDGGFGLGDVNQTFHQNVPPTCGNEIDQNPPPVFYPVFAAYTGNAVDSLTSANCLPVSLDALPNAVEFDAVKGQTYQIAFDGNMGTTGDIPLYLALTQPAANDNFEQRIRLHGIYVEATGYNAGATHQTGEPLFGDSSGKTVWWSWTAPVTGTVSIDLSGSDYSFPVAIFTGSTRAGLQMVAENSGGVSFFAVEGHTYQIAVSDFGGLTGTIELKLQAPIIELVLSKTVISYPSAPRLFHIPSTRQATLFYQASAGQKILLQRSNDGANWQNVQTSVVVFQKNLQFLVNPAPANNGPYYRAIIIDRTF